MKEDFGFFSVPRRLAPWAELLIIQLLVPHASFLGHLSGIVAGFIYISTFNPFHMLFPNLAKLVGYPVTAIYTALFGMVHYDVIDKPWTSKQFWSSGTPLVCLSVNRLFGEYRGGFKIANLWRLLSGPLEHASDTHLIICLISFLNKGYILER